LITRYDDRDMIVGSEEGVYFDQLSPEISFTIYNPYPFTLNLTNTIENADEEGVNPDSKDKFIYRFSRGSFTWKIKRVYGKFS